MSDDLEAKINWLEALERIRTVKHKYFISLDKARWDDVVNCFTEDAIIDVGMGTQSGHAEIAKFFQDVYVNAFEWWAHQASNPLIDITSDTTATGTWELEGFVVTKEPASGMWTAVFYEDEYRKEDGNWLIAKSIIVPIFRCDVEEGYTKQRMVGLPED